MTFSIDENCLFLIDLYLPSQSFETIVVATFLISAINKANPHHLIAVHESFQNMTIIIMTTPACHTIPMAVLIAL